MSVEPVAPTSVLVTGAGGNLGRKIVEALALTSWCRRIVALDRRTGLPPYSPAASARTTWITGDLTDPHASWRDALAGVDAVIHFAAQNPDVNATWAEAAVSFDMTVNLGLAAVACGLRRFVFASSNHVMGGYKDAPLAGIVGPGRLTTALAPAPGTRWHDGTRRQDSTAYATAKLMGERFVTALAHQAQSRLTAVSVRIGWAQPGDNRPQTISHAGSIIGGVPLAASEEARRDLRWFRNMWLADEDLASLFLAAVEAGPAAWPAPGIVVNGTSCNRASDWDLTDTARWLGYEPRHNLYAELG